MKVIRFYHRLNGSANAIANHGKSWAFSELGANKKIRKGWLGGHCLIRIGKSKLPSRRPVPARAARFGRIVIVRAGEVCLNDAGGTHEIPEIDVAALE